MAGVAKPIIFNFISSICECKTTNVTASATCSQQKCTYCCRTYQIRLLADNSPYTISATTCFTTTEHYNSSFIFEAASDSVSLTVSSKPSQCFHLLIYLKTYFCCVDCSSNMYGGFNGSICRPCPTNSTSQAGFYITNCECAVGYALQDGGQCNGTIVIYTEQLIKLYMTSQLIYILKQKQLGL